MEDFATMLNSAMKDRGYSVRALEVELVKRYGSKKKISRSLIGDYKQGKRAPTYDGAAMIASVLEINKEKLLTAAFILKSRIRQEAERRRFEEFCKKNEISIPGRWLQ